MTKVSTALFIEQLGDFQPHTAAELAVSLNISVGTVRNMRKKAQKEGMTIIWSSKGYMLLPSEGTITELEQILAAMDYTAFIRGIRDYHEKQRQFVMNIQARLPEEALASVYLKPVKEHVIHVAGDLEEMQDFLSTAKRKRLKTMPYNKGQAEMNGDGKREIYFLQTRYWSIVRAVVMNRAGGTCEYCNKEPGTDCHHVGTTNREAYKIRGYEDKHLDKLMWVCRPCHEMLENEKDD